MEHLTNITWRYLSGIVVGSITAVAFLLLRQYPRPLAMLCIVIIWLALLWGVDYLIRRSFAQQYRLLPLYIFLGISIVGLFFVVELSLIRNILLVVGAALFGILFAANLKGPGLWESMKPLRRFIMINWVIAAYAFMTTLFAISSFFQGKYVSVLTILLGAIMYGYVAMNIWRLYFQSPMRPLVLWAMIVGIVSLELVWVVGLLPFVYGVLALLVTWLWYILQLFARFHFSARGIEWKKQMPFLISNAALFIVLLAYFVRWV